MAWQDNIDTKIQITTGDGKTYNPQYKISEFEREYNNSIFEFPELEGSLVDRRKVKGTKFNLTVYFQGEEHIEDFNAFEESARDERPWTIYHPIKGNILCQPLSMKDDASGLGVTRVEISLMTTIKKSPPRITQDPRDAINYQNAVTKQTIEDGYTSSGDDPTPQNKATITETVKSLETSAEKLEKTQNEWDAFKNEANKAISEVNNVIGEATNGINSVINTIAYPSLFTDSVRSKITNFRAQLDLLLANLGFLKSPQDKKTFELLGSSYLNAMVFTVSNPQDGDYLNAIDVVNIAQILTEAYNDYTAALDEVQTETGSELDAFIPNYDTSAALDSQVNMALTNLLEIALTGQLERRFILEADSDPISLTHRLYGTNDDATLTRFIDENNIGLSKILEIKKGTEIVYYV